MKEKNRTGRIFAIGDIHGCHKKLQKLIKRLPYEPGRDRLVFLGDFIDRGPDTAKVLDLICELRTEDPGLIGLIGNHEYLLFEYHRSGEAALLPYLRNMGIQATLKSYGIETSAGLSDLSFLPAAHRSFLDSLVPWWETDDYIFVHAGIEPGRPLADHDLTSLTEVRDTFLTDNTDFGKKVIFGHTEFELPFITPTRIGIDTGAVYGNLLTAVELPAEIFYHA